MSDWTGPHYTTEEMARVADDLISRLPTTERHIVIGPIIPRLREEDDPYPWLFSVLASRAPGKGRTVHVGANDEEDIVKCRERLCDEVMQRMPDHPPFSFDFFDDVTEMIDCCERLFPDDLKEQAAQRAQRRESRKEDRRC